MTAPRIFACLLLVTGLFSTTAQAQVPPRYVPTVAVEAGTFAERLDLDLDAMEQSEDRWLWATSLSFGLEYRLPEDWLDGGLRSHTSLGIGLVFERGQWPLDVRERLVWKYQLTGALSVFAGLGTGLRLNLSDIDFSAWELSAPLGIRLGPVEVCYRPGLTIPLGSDSSQVFGGERQHSVRGGIVPLNLVVRLHVAALGF